MIMEVDYVTSDILEGETIEIDDNNDIYNLEGERCGICMDIIFDRGVLDCCQHWFCFGCIDNWATITNLCPLCQNEFQLITCVPVYDTIGNNKVDDDLVSRDDEWCIEGKNNSLSFPSYYIDENAVICLDGDGCKIRSGSVNLEEDSNLDTSIACDSCDVWYHAFCVGFDPEGTYEDTWLCPRCVAGEVPQKSDVTSIQRPSSQSDPEISHPNSLPEATFSKKLTVTIADVGETALVISMVDDIKPSEEASEKFYSTLGVDEDLKIDAADGDSLKGETPSSVKTEIPSILEGHELDLSLSRDSSFSQLSTPSVLSESKSSCDAVMNLPNSSRVVKSCLRKLSSDSSAENKLSESETSIGLNLGLSVSSLFSVDQRKNNGTEDQGTEDVQQETAAEPLSGDEKIPSHGNEEAVKMIGSKRKHTDCSVGVLRTAAVEEDDGGTENASGKKRRTKDKFQMEFKDQANESLPDDSHGCLSLVTVSKEVKSKKFTEKEDIKPDIMSIVKEIRRKPSQGLADKSLKERENAAGLRVKKIMRRATEDKESSSVVQKLRAEIREAVRKRTSEDVGEHLFDPKLLAAFRTAVAGPTTEAVEKLPPSALKAKKSLLQKGKIRENLTKKIYANTNGKRKRAWDRECEVEFWKHRCMRTTKPEKVATLKSVLNLLTTNPEGSEVGKGSECQGENPILSRLYLADTSVFPRKNDIKPLSVFTASSNPEQNRGHVISTEKGQSSSSDDRTQKTTDASKVSLKVGVPSVHDKGSTDKVPIPKGKAACSKAHSDVAPLASLGGLKINSQKETGKESEVKKVDKRKWALEVLARKKAAAGTNGMQEKQEDNVLLKKGNFPLLAQLPIDMRPVLAQSHHNKIPVSVRQMQLYRLAEHFLRKVNLPEIRRTAETELAVADAINIEKAVTDKSNSKLVYMNLCSQEISRRADNSESVRVNESNTSSIQLELAEQSEEASELPTDPAIMDALKNAGLLSDSPPNSPCHNKQTSDEPGNSQLQSNEEGPENVFEMDSLPEVDIYGDFDYVLDDEDYIGAAAIKDPKLPPEIESKMKVVFSTLKCERPDDVQDFEDSKLEVTDESKLPTAKLKGHIDPGIISLSTEGENDNFCILSGTSRGEECAEPSLAECEELYGPEKEPLVSKFPEETSKQVNRLNDVGGSAEKQASGQVEQKIVGSVGRNSCNGENSTSHSGTSENIPKKDTSKIDSNKESDAICSVTKKVETYIKEHIRPLCKSGIITVEQYRWAVAKTTDKVMKYHPNAKNANFLIKGGEKVKKLAEQYVESAQQL
ncbi:uncharacterized protein At4g10930 [Mercurialis annua]|uniref:uncharacterized protein At4g10930 n=1 Tax=Mercurialis annua TaxID=3986 RepID=UPI00215F1F7B|nr:uncharacterized protein At4g10930 [Mercurialis annua]XP_050228259.1 uncharacterized protein At4g10930 [Mercurialis annua]